MQTEDKNVEQRRDALFDILRQHKVISCRIEYSGSGDSGQVDYINVELEGQDEQVDMEEWEKTIGSEEQIAIKVGNKLQGIDDEKSLYQTFEHFAYDALDFAGAADWCNNDGGSGIMTFHLDDEEHDPKDWIEIDHGWYEQVRHDQPLEL